VKTLFLSPVGEVGGAERLMLDLMAGLRRTEPGWQVDLICGAPGPLLDAAGSLGVNASVLALPTGLSALGESTWSGTRHERHRMAILLRSIALMPYLLRLRRALRAAGADLIHSNGLKMHVLGALAAPAGVPLVWHIHDFLAPRVAMRQLLRAFRFRCACAVAISGAIARDCAASWAGRTPIRTVLNATDVETFSPDGPVLELDALCGMEPAPDGTVRVGLVATFGRLKGHETFLHALAKLPLELPWRAFIVGGPLYSTAGSQVEASALRSLAASLGIAGRVGFTGFIAAPAAAMRALDVVVHASSAPEPFGLVIVEGMACGKAVVASLGGGVAEIVQPGEDALVHHPGDVAGLADAIRRLVEDAGLRARLGSTARRVAVERFDRARLGPEIITLYRAVLARRAG
jgi:glycosyltransferase involved in cell wall biosynthesis